MAGIVSLQRLVESIERFYLCGEGLGWKYREDRGPPDFLPHPDSGNGVAVPISTAPYTEF